MRIKKQGNYGVTDMIAAIMATIFPPNLLIVCPENREFNNVAAAKKVGHSDFHCFVAWPFGLMQVFLETFLKCPGLSPASCHWHCYSFADNLK